MEKLSVNPIGTIKSGQVGTCIVMDEKYVPALKGLKGFSHVIVVWWFHEFDNEEARNAMQVQSPYKSSPPSLGTFATRSPLRPNPVALSVVQAIHIDEIQGIIQIPFIDANEGSPVIDLKPYTPSLDRVESPHVPEWCWHWPGSLEKSAYFDWAGEFNF
ncbi:SAM-dependent methyltransferase [Paenibacillus sp. Marseille-P2973]|uniref:SAM-dependent methyltransferase n=1 Tax=Paenibacillus sp. Marseille-P2973 TaxID=1871032 RepID=UPI001B36F51D|nr:SAM-dependent methyltransferase [Paenibacillus sp. Marseille-P2973]